MEKLIKILQDKHDAFIGNRKDQITSANAKGFKEGLAWAIDTAKSIIEQELDMSTKVKSKNETANGTKPVLSDGWISVKEQLPECWSQHRNDYGSGYVLGYTKYGEWEITQLWNNKDWEGDDDNEGDYITHWMPLSVPPTCR